MVMRAADHSKSDRGRGTVCIGGESGLISRCSACQIFPPAPPARAGGLPISIRSETAGSWEQCSQSSSQRASKCVWITASLGLDTWVLGPEINTSREGKQGGGGMNMGHV